MAGLSHTADKLFRGILSTKKGECLRRDGRLSYTRMRELFLAKIEQLGMVPKQFGMHSLWAGGATTTANTEVPDRLLIKRHGRWRSDAAKDGYVKDSVERRLTVSKGLAVRLGVLGDCLITNFAMVCVFLFVYMCICAVSAQWTLNKLCYHVKGGGGRYMFLSVECSELD